MTVSDPTTTSPLTDLEQHALSLSAELANTLVRIVGQGPASKEDLAELLAPLHAIQRSLMAQGTARIYPGRYRLLGERLVQ